MVKLNRSSMWTIRLTSERGSPRRGTTHDRYITTTSLKRGERRRVEDRSDGMTVVVKRTVLDADGQVLHRDRWVSRYRWLGGTVLEGIG